MFSFKDKCSYIAIYCVPTAWILFYTTANEFCSKVGVKFWSENGVGSIRGSMMAFCEPVADCFKMSNIESLLDIFGFMVREWALSSTRPLLLAFPYGQQGSCKLPFNDVLGKPACQTLVQHLVAARDRLCRAGSERTDQPCPQQKDACLSEGEKKKKWKKIVVLFT